MKSFRIIVAWCLLLIWGGIAVASAAPEATPMRIRGTVFFSSYLKVYGILSEDGKKYHPTRKLPNEFLRDGLEVVVEGRLREDLVGARMWGTAFEVKQITQASRYIGPEDREAIRLLLERMAAFNGKNLDKLKQIDLMAATLSQEQFAEWLFGSDSFTLHYVDTAITQDLSPVGATIKGQCLYSRVRMNSMAVSGNVQHTVMKFTMTKTDSGWKFAETGAYQPGTGQDMELLLKELKAKAKEKYGTDNLAAWKG